MSDEVEGNLERARDRLDAARLLLKNDKYEDAVNRAYYSMYHSAMALLRAKGVSPRTHRGLIGEFGRKFVREGEVNRRYSTMLSHADSLRESADYGLKSEIKREDAREVVENAENFLKMAVNQFSE